MNEIQQRVFSNQYFNLNKTLLQHSGLWPPKSKLDRLIQRIVINGLALFLMYPNILSCEKWCFGNLALCAENIAGLIILGMVVIKHTITRLFEAKIEKVYMLVADNWMTLTDPEEHAILENCAKESHRMTNLYFIYYIFGATCFSQSTIVNPVLDTFFPLNESRPMILVVQGEYIVDPSDYFYSIYVLYSIIGVIITILFPAVDTIQNTVVYQCAGIFRIAQHRLVKATTYSNEKKARETMVSAIELHKQALYFLELIETSYSFYYLVLICGSLVTTIGSCAIVDNLNEPLIAVKFILFGVGFVIHLFYMSWPGQLIIQESGNIFTCTYHNSWYESSKQVKWMLLFVMQRCIRPSVLTAGGLYIMNFENAGIQLKTAVSYITFALSLQ